MEKDFFILKKAKKEFKMYICVKWWIMTVIIKANATKADIENQLQKLKDKKRFNAKKYLGKLDWGQDPLVYQQELRRE